jgi:hypothetical protein
MSPPPKHHPFSSTPRTDKGIRGGRGTGPIPAPLGTVISVMKDWNASL